MPNAYGFTNYATILDQTVMGSMVMGDGIVNTGTLLLAQDPEDNVGLFTALFGTNAARVLAIGGQATAPTTRPADVVQLWVQDRAGGAGTAGLALLPETNTPQFFGDRVGLGTLTPTSFLEVAGSFGLPVVSKTSAYTATISDHTILCNATSAAFTVSLPTAAGITGRRYTVKKTDSSGNAVTVDPAGSETIDGSTTKTLSAQWDWLTVQSNGTNWVTVAQTPGAGGGGTVTGTGTATYVALWTGTSAIGGDAGFQYDGATDQATIINALRVNDAGGNGLLLQGGSTTHILRTMGAGTVLSIRNNAGRAAWEFDNSSNVIQVGNSTDAYEERMYLGGGTYLSTSYTSNMFTIRTVGASSEMRWRGNANRDVLYLAHASNQIDLSNTTDNYTLRLLGTGNFGLGATSFGTSAARVLGLAEGTAPSTSPTDMVQLWSANSVNGAGKNSLFLRTEDGTSHTLGDYSGIGTTSPSHFFHVLWTITQPAAAKYAATVELAATNNANTSQATGGLQVTTTVDQGSYNRSSTVGGVRGVYSNTIVSGSSGTITTAYSLGAQCQNTGAGIVTDFFGLYVPAPVNSGGGTITNMHGVYVTAHTVGTNIYGVRSEIAAGSNRWNLYMGGTAQNYMAGPLALGATTSVASALMELVSTTQGFLPPRLTTTQKNAVSSPATGLVVYDTTLNKLCVYTGAAWQTVTST